jgi:superfamily II DNA or RNA helicase
MCLAQPTAKAGGEGFQEGFHSMDRDPRRIFTDAQKREVLAAHSFRCQGLNCKDPDLSGKPFDFHHIRPHSQLGATTRTNCVPLCKPCHLEYTRRDRIEDFGKPWLSLRQWQRDAVDRYVDNYEQKMFVLEAAPGAGKSLFAATIASYELDSGSLGVEHVICIAPWTPIIKSLKKSFGVYDLETREKFRYDDRRGVYQSRPYVPVTIDTYQAFCKQLSVDILDRWVNDSAQKFKFMLILDEVHHTNTSSGKWGSHLLPVVQMAEKVVVMSGTYFRSDSKEIAFLEYENNKPRTSFSINYSECVANRYTRQVSFRYHDPLLDVYSNKHGEVKRMKISKIPVASTKMMTAAKSSVLDPSGDHVEAMIREAWSELKAMRKKWSDAACLVVCRSGKDGVEERAVHAVSQRIHAITGQRPETVTSDDAASRGKIDAFVDSDSPFLCAIRMVSEGVDVPRIRMVLFISYTDSEMLFRQIVGRATRYIEGKDDDTAALVIMPKFPVMAGFADRFEGEAKIGAADMETRDPRQKGDAEPGGICRACGSDPCKCFVVVGSEATADGGRIADGVVQEDFIQIAKTIRDGSKAHQHANPVQLADALQRGHKMKAQPVEVDYEVKRAMAWRAVERQIKNMAKYVYGGEISLAWVREVHEHCGADAAEIKSTWRIEQIRGLEVHLQGRFLESITNA